MTPARPTLTRHDMPLDGEDWAAAACPVCHMLARARPERRGAQAVACPSCGMFRLSGAAQAIFDAAASPDDRERLSEVFQDACPLTNGAMPLIDGLTAGVLVALAGLPLAGREVESDRKRFFFEKKNQKTFGLDGAARGDARSKLSR